MLRLGSSLALHGNVRDAAGAVERVAEGSQDVAAGVAPDDVGGTVEQVPRVGDMHAAGGVGDECRQVVPGRVGPGERAGLGRARRKPRGTIVGRTLVQGRGTGRERAVGGQAGGVESYG